MRRRALILATLLLLWQQLSIMAQQPLPTTAPGTYVRANRLGVTFINSTDHPISERRYQQALLLGAGWNRWPLYWERVETSPGSFNWSAYDRLVSEDLRHGFFINAILMGRPAFYQSGGSINGLDSPVFADGTDTLAPGKAINSANPWASFVYQTVNRYKPGGTLSAQSGWPPGWGIRVWEAWNEPDLPQFWRGSVQDYARLLKVTWLAAHLADPDAQVMFGGLAYSNPELSDWLARTLAVLAQDSQRAQHDWYIDLVAVHNYTYARRSGEVVRRARENLARYGLSRPIWLNENGVPVWDDYPGPSWAAENPEARTLRGTQQQQAAFVIESAAYAWAEGADVIIFHQLYDDCGNQPAGTDFAPNDGRNAGDAHGLFRNLSDGECFRQHPFPGTPRPAAFAYRMLAQMLGSVPFSASGVQYEGRTARVTLEQPMQRITIAWNRTLQGATLTLPAARDSALLYALDGSETPLNAAEGQFSIALAAAAPDDFPFLYPGDEAAIGGNPVIVVERTGSLASPVPTALFNPALVPFPAPLYPTRAPFIPTPQPGGTIEPLLPMTRPTEAQQGTPETFMDTLPLVSPAVFRVSWGSSSEIASYIVWVRVNGGDWQPWQETSATSADYNGESGRLYEFAVWAVDTSGNWSANSDLRPQTYTRVE